MTMQVQRPPNVLVVMADQLRRDALGCYGAWAPTPHLDALAARSAVFEHAVTNSPVCKPARFSLALGQYPHNHGLWSNGAMKLAPDTPTWTSSVRDVGYGTSLFGKLHLRGARDLRTQESSIRSLGYDVVAETVGPRGCLRGMSHMVAAWEDAGVADAFRADLAERLTNDAFVVRPSPLPLDLYYDVWVPSTAIDHLARLPADQPWCCTVSFGGPHEPFDTPEPYASRFLESEIPPPLPPLRRPDSAPVTTLDARGRPGQRMDPDRLRAIRADYAGAVALIDDQVGRLLRTVEERGDREHTIVVVTSDHGEMLGDHGLFYKNTFLDGALRIPLLISVPGVPPRRVSGPVELLDVGATIVDLVGGEPVPLSFGRSLAGMLHGGPPVRDVALSEFEGEYLITDGRFKLVVNTDGDSAMLTDTADDPDERTDRIGDSAFADVEARLRDALLRRLAATQLDRAPADRPGNVRRQVEHADSFHDR